MFLLFSLFCFYLVVSGFSQYNNFFADLDYFKEYEQLKASQYLNYEQYGSYGFRIMTKPPALSIFFSSYNFINLESTVNTKEIVNVVSPLKGGEFFKTFVSHQDFSGFLYIFGSFLMLYFGFSTFKGNDSFRLRKNMKNTITSVLFRGIAASVFFLGVMAVSWMLAVILGVKFSTGDLCLFGVYSLYSILFLYFFFVLGVLIAFIKSFSGYSFIFAALIWLLLVIIIPEIHKLAIKRSSFSLDRNEFINTLKLEGLFEFETKAREYAATLGPTDDIREKLRGFVSEHYKTTYDQNKGIEHDLELSVDRLMKIIDHQAILCPTIFYSHLSRELSGKGGVGYRSFLQHILDLKDSFFEFYMTRRYDSNAAKMDMFIQSDDQIFSLESMLPVTIIAGFLGLVLYLLVIGALSIFTIWLRLKIEPMEGVPVISVKDLQKGKFYFYYCKNPEQREKIIQHTQSISNSAVLRKVSDDFFDHGISLRCWYRYMCSLEGLNPKSTTEFLKLIGVKATDWNLDTANVDIETLAILYLAVKIAKQVDLYIYDDFTKGRTRRFETLFNLLVKKAPTNLYIGSDMFDLVNSSGDLNESIVFSIDPGKRITFR